MYGKTIWRTVQHILKDKGIKLSLEQYNRYYQIANEELKRMTYGRVGEQQGFETDPLIKDTLLPFTTNSTITITSGEGNLPTDYWHKISASIVSTGVDIKFCTSEESLRKRNNSITKPSLSYPIAELFGTKIKVYPTSITSIILNYLKVGNIPTVVLKVENSIVEYDEAYSIEPSFKSDKAIDLIRLIVSYLSLPMSPEQVLSYMEQKIEKET